VPAPPEFLTCETCNTKVAREFRTCPHCLHPVTLSENARKDRECQKEAAARREARRLKRERGELRGWERFRDDRATELETDRERAQHAYEHKADQWAQKGVTYTLPGGATVKRKYPNAAARIAADEAFARRMTEQTLSPPFARMAARYLQLAVLGTHVWQVRARKRGGGNAEVSEGLTFWHVVFTIVAGLLIAAFFMGCRVGAWCARRHAALPVLPVDAPEREHGGRGNAGENARERAGPAAGPADQHAAPPPPAPGPEGMDARFNAGVCTLCLQRIHAGQRIARNAHDRGWHHVACPRPAAAAATRTVGVQAPVHFTWYNADSRFKASNHGFSRGGEVTIERPDERW
jgi:hypothetical protein